MPLAKTPVTLNFAKGLETKVDPNQVPVGNFLTLQNSIFDKAGALTKRNGFANITTLPNSDQTTLTTLNGNLIASGSNLYAYSLDTSQWLNQGIVQPIQLNTIPLVRVSTSQTSPDIAVSSTGSTCLVYMDNSASYYQISDSNTGQQIVARVALPVTAVSPRVYVLGRYFIVTFIAIVSSADHLQYIAIPIANPTAPKAPVDISANVAALGAGYDAVVANNSLYISWAGSSNTVRTTFLTSTLIVGTPVSIASHTATIMSVSADTSASTAIIWLSFWDSSSTNAYVASYNQQLVQVLAPTLIASTVTLATITSVANNQSCQVFYETNHDYASPYPTSIRTDFISSVSISQSGTVGTTNVILRSVGLASKAFIASNGNTYMIATYGEQNHDLSIASVDQPTYFLIDSLGVIYMRLAYSNGGGYESSQVLPTVSLLNDTYYIPYLIADFLSTINGSDLGVPKNTNQPAAPNTAIYTQTGVNLAKFKINSSGQYSSEIAGALHLTGGQLWEYDGVRPVEHGFHVWPDNVAVTTATGSGGLIAQDYFYQFTYEWTDNQGNLHRSAPSVPVQITTTTSSSTNTIYVPTLRLTDKIAPNPVRIVGYRWSTAQQIYYQFTSLTSPAINNPAVDFVTITDAKSDDDILGNNIIYTNGGVIENIAAPASTVSTLFKNRLFLVDAEDQNLLWYSKQVIENTPVEMSDLLTLYVAPTTGVQGSTGPITALSAMDDKLIIFKKDAIYYLTGTGPDNTGAQNDFTDPVFITSSVGCINQRSLVMQPGGLMFQSDKGIWILGRDLSSNYIGAPVEKFNNNTIMSADSIPGTNQIRFILDTGVTLLYDYYYGQWGTFTNIRAISSALYQGLQTYLNSFGQIYQETPGLYLDGSIPVLMSFTTSWINLAGLRGFERFYEMYVLGTYYSPFKLQMQISYDFAPQPLQSIMVTQANYAQTWGGEAVWGSGGPWGGVQSAVFQAQVSPKKQKCQTFQIIVNEIYDASYGVVAGQGLSLSGINMVIGAKLGYPKQKGSRSFG